MTSSAAPRFFSPVRLVAGLVAVGLLAFPLYFLLLDPARDGGLEPAVLLTTPPLGGRSVGVGVAEGKLAPDFEISTPDGTRVRLSELRGRPVVMNFWARWCTSCLSEMPELQSLQAERGTDTFTVLAVNAGETPDQAQEFIDFLKAPFVYGLDLDLTVSDSYGVFGLPLSVFIDSEGVVQGVYNGHASRAILTQLADAAIDARPAGPIPPVLRLISTIYRERTLDVKTIAAGQLRFESRSLRCDISYCADSTLEALRQNAGIRSVTRLHDTAVAVEFDVEQYRAEQLIEAVVELLNRSDDPVYKSELVVRMES